MSMPEHVRGKKRSYLWVDYKRGRKITDGTPIRTVKVYADVHADGSLKVLSWCKKQPMKVENYLLKRVEVYRIRKEIFEGGISETGGTVICSYAICRER